MKPIKIEQENLNEFIQSGHSYIQVGEQIYFLMELEEVNNHDGYQVSDSVEEKQLIKAMRKENPIQKVKLKKY